MDDTRKRRADKERDRQNEMTSRRRSNRVYHNTTHSARERRIEKI